MPVYFVDLTDDLYISKEEEFGFVDTSSTILIKYVLIVFVIRCVYSVRPPLPPKRSWTTSAAFVSLQALMAFGPY